MIAEPKKDARAAGERERQWMGGAVSAVLVKTAATTGAVLLIAACSAPQAPPTPAPAPSVAPTPTVRPAVPPTSPPPTAAPTQAAANADAAPSEVENAFLANVDDAVAVATDLAVSSCDDLTAATRTNPGMLVSLHGYAATLKRLGTSQAALNTDAVKSALGDLEHALSQLDGLLTQCGIPVPTPTP